MLSEFEIRAIAEKVKAEAKETARVDQGTLRRSIAFTYVKGVVTFRQIYYGDFKDNSQLEKIARRLMPYGVPYKIELTEFGGGTYEVKKTRLGRVSISKTLKELSGKTTTQRIRNLIAIQKKKKNDKEKE